MKRLWLWFLWTLASSARVKGAAPSGVVDARLVNGDSKCSGNLEIKHEGQWKTLKTKASYQYSRSTGFAEMACRQMGCGSAASVQFVPNASEPKPAWEINFSCRNPDQTIRQCKDSAQRKRVEAIESYNSSIAVTCSETLRITSETISTCSGTVTLKLGQSWFHVCVEDGLLDQSLADRMCADLGCGTSRMNSSSTLQTAVETRSLQCSGNETLQDCPTTAQRDCKRVLTLDCDNPYSLRLVGGANQCQGILEGKNGLEWRPFSRGWSDTIEIVSKHVCEEVGCGSLIRVTAVYSPQSLPLWELDCWGGSGFCNKWRYTESEDMLQVSCTESVKWDSTSLFGRPRPEHCTGSVMVKQGGSWRALCHQDYTLAQGLVGCRELECGFPHAPVKMFLKNITNALSTNCSGHEASLLDCPVSASPAGGSTCQPAFLRCDESPSAPEMQTFSRMSDSTSTKLTVNRGHRVLVVCRVSSPSTVLTFNLQFQSSETVLLQNKTAVANADQFVLEPLTRSQEGFYKCSYDFESSPEKFSEEQRIHLSITDWSYVRLVGGESGCVGVLQLQHGGEWRPVQQEQWSRSEASVVCRQLLCGFALHTDTQSRAAPLRSTWRFFSDCDGSEHALLGCGSIRDGASADTIHVLCSDIVAAPTISVLSDRFHPEDAETVVVPEALSVSLNCSVEPTFPGGRFSLLFNGEEQTKLREKSSDYTALFSLPSVTKAQSGSYICVYRNTMCYRDFTFQSKKVNITVKESRDVDLSDGCSGTLLMRKDSSAMKMVTAEASSWDLRHASIACRQLGCGDAASTSRIQLQASQPAWGFFSDCEGGEASLLQCGQIDEWFSPSAIYVSCEKQRVKS
ncbi:unnamed protein product [Knipowitschia caucasica]|uniref:Uncharacterized protein n=1 Tax=Knipowitschia caucasica TaxID=637954 RepID=A0AAV2LJ21_KNICA